LPTQILQQVSYFVLSHTLYIDEQSKITRKVASKQQAAKKPRNNKPLPILHYICTLYSGRKCFYHDSPTHTIPEQDAISNARCDTKQACANIQYLELKAKSD
jgi:hypothetical protein